MALPVHPRAVGGGLRRGARRRWPRRSTGCRSSAAGLHSQLAPVVAGIGTGRADRLRAARRRRAAGRALGHGAPAEDAAAAGDGGRGRAVLRRRRAGGLYGLRARVGEGEGIRRRRLRHRAGHRRQRLGARPRRPRGRPTRPMRPPRWAGGRSSSSDTRAATRASATGASPTTRAPRSGSSSASARLSGPSGLGRDAELGDVVEVDVDGWREVVREPVPDAHGPPRGRRPVVLRGRIRGGRLHAPCSAEACSE